MRQYIKNLTDNLIGKNRYDEVWGKFRQLPEAFLNHVQIDLQAGDVNDMSPETLGKVMCSFEDGEVSSARLGHEVHFTGDCEVLLRDIVARALAYVIRDRFYGSCFRNPNIPLYKRKGQTASAE